MRSRSHSLGHFHSARTWSHRRRPIVSALAVPELESHSGERLISVLLVHVQSVQIKLQHLCLHWFARYLFNISFLMLLSFCLSLCAAKKKLPKLPKEAFEQQPAAAT